MSPVSTISGAATVFRSPNASATRDSSLRTDGSAPGATGIRSVDGSVVVDGATSAPTLTSVASSAHARGRRRMRTTWSAPVADPTSSAIASTTASGETARESPRMSRAVSAISASCSRSRMSTRRIVTSARTAIEKTIATRTQSAGDAVPEANSRMITRARAMLRAPMEIESRRIQVERAESSPRRSVSSSAGATEEVPLRAEAADPRGRAPRNGRTGAAGPSWAVRRSVTGGSCERRRAGRRARASRRGAAGPRRRGPRSRCHRPRGRPRRRRPAPRRGSPPPGRRNDSARNASSIRAAARRADAASVSGRMIANSSPP